MAFHLIWLMLVALSREMLPSFATDYNWRSFARIEDYISLTVVDNDRCMLAVSQGIGDCAVPICFVRSSHRDYLCNT
jgi:hypothetical protein